MERYRERLAHRGWEQRNDFGPLVLLTVYEVGAPDDLHVEGGRLSPVQKGSHVGIRMGYRARLHPLLQEGGQEDGRRRRGHRRWGR
jgi:hypothetical protein